ncbi:MAG TPA: Arm DNA-binding domain-containing protein [Pedobacter sp.]|nr:Arm DNA-binding domain-containing protein [Pedobacter sp.]
MKTNLSLLFYLKKRNSKETGPAAIYLRITIDGKRAELATCFKCDPEKWSHTAGKMIGTKECILSG